MTKLILAAVAAVVVSTAADAAPKKTTLVKEDVAKEDVAFANCTEAKAAGYVNIRRGQPGYAPKLDRDNDGIACEKK